MVRMTFEYDTPQIFYKERKKKKTYKGNYKKRINNSTLIGGPINNCGQYILGGRSRKNTNPYWTIVYRDLYLW